jgi:hypothetical protein
VPDGLWVSLSLGLLFRGNLGAVMADGTADRRSRYSVPLADEVTANPADSGSLQAPCSERGTCYRQSQQGCDTDLEHKISFGRF